MKKKIIFRNINLKKHISKKRVFFGIITGLLFSFTFYAFLFSIREAVRVVFSTNIDIKSLLILNEKEISFYNFIFALFSSILGLSLTLKIILENSRKIGNNRYFYRKKHSIFNDLSALNSVFLGVGVKLIFFISILFGSTFFFHLSFYPNYKFIAYLLFITLFLEQWKTIRLIFKNKALKWMAISLISILIYSFIISQITIINYEKINNLYISNRLDYKFKIELPEVFNFKKSQRISLTPELYFAYPKGEVNHGIFPLIITESQETYNLETLVQFIDQVKQTHSEYELPRITFKLNIDKNIKMKHIKLLKKTIAENNFNKIMYAVTQKDSKIPKELQYNIGVFERLKRVIPPLPPEPIIDKENSFTIEINTNNSILINGKKKSMDMIDIKEFILKSPKENIFQLQFSDATNLNDYLIVKDLLLKAYYETRTDLSIKSYGLPLSELNREQLRNIKIKLPQLIWVKD